MSRHDPSLRLRHMLDHAREAVAMAQGKTRTELDRQLNLALVRLAEQLSAAQNELEEEVLAAARKILPQCWQKK